MKRVHVSIATLVLAGSLCGQAQEPREQKAKPFSVDDFTKMGVEEKRRAFGERLEAFTERNRYLELHLLGMRDGDRITQRRAMQSATVALLTLQQAKREGIPVPADLPRLGEFQHALLTKLSSSDAYARQLAVLALAQSAAASHQLETVLLERYWKDPDPSVRSAVIKAMDEAGYDSPAYVRAVGNALVNDSSQGREIRAAAVRAVMQLKPTAALPLLARLVQEYQTSVTLGPAVEALAAYGGQARPYLPLLQALLASERLSTDQRSRERVEKAIEAIQNPQPTQAARVKALDLVESLPAPAVVPEPSSEPGATASADAALTKAPPVTRTPVMARFDPTLLILGTLSLFAALACGWWWWRRPRIR